MMKAGFNPSRRSQNIGTAKQGHGQDNRLVIPKARHTFSTLDRIGRFVKEERHVQGQCVTFIVEETRQGSVHAWTVDDVAKILGMVPASDWAGIKTIVFRQPTRKQTILNPAWGRLRYSGEVSTTPDRKVAIGPMILLDAIDENLRIRRPASMGPEDQLELDRLRADGHVIERAGRTHTIMVTPGTARNTQLYRTLFHEVGHWFDWLEKVEGPAQRGECFETLMDSYFAQSVAEREAFAHRYADGIRERLINLGSIPFGSI